MLTFLNESKGNLDKLEKTYREELRLEGPVDLWHKRVSKFRHQGIIWSSLLALSVIAIVVLPYMVLYDIPESFRSGLLEGKPEGIKGIIILATIVSFAAYLIRIFGKLTFSSFHL